MLPKHLIQTETIIKTVEIILQSRIDVKKSQQKQLNSVMQEVHRNWENAYGGSIYTFFNQLLIKEYYPTRQKVAHSELENPIHYITIVFKLIEKSTSKPIETQSWVINFKRRGEQVKQQSKNMLICFFQQLVLFLNHQPLFREYQKSKYLKTHFMLDHKLTISQSKLKSESSLLSLPTNYQKIRQSETFEIYLYCYFVPSLAMACGEQPLFQQKKKKNTQKHRNSSEFIEERQTMSSSKPRVYSFYDPQLDITMLSSDNQVFRKSSQQVAQIKIESKDEDSEQQFELLIINEEQKFFEDNKQVFEKLKNMEINYL